MNTKRILLGGMALVLTGACAWAATETPGFTPLAESEAAPVVGGDGYVCDYYHSITGDPEFWPCSNNGNNTGCLEGVWCYKMARYGCVPAESGDCYTDLMMFVEYGACAWDADQGYCAYDGEVYFDYIEACG